MTRTPEEVAGRIQHTEVGPTADQNRIEELCEECIEYGFDGAMVQACWAPLASDRLADTDVTVCSAVGFPMGGDRPVSKAAAIRDAVAAGAEEVDVMPNVGFVKSGRFEDVRREMELVVDASGDATVKAMLELGALDDDEAERIVDLAVDAGFDYVKNSSGWGEGGTATVERVEFLRERAPEDVKVKASGGIKTLAGADELLDAGADLLGASSGVEIVTGAVGDGEY
ncbi:deoxyribose-phosphate aldolase [Halosimplex rubrum]|uniref:Deoxyribose-phosphate aldolase n=1 Tax=Halosimplex rubrum TaxID=869889 RepID=A0A7D5P466_9EURY|nr:deoxyribose-phosphate aldolase [Halosimplex rubrum]QLH77804.1 deoxyribose-phosphate aldolase [Halosimplex rubrum]